MDARKTWFTSLIILVCVSLVASLDYTRPAEEVFLGQLVDPATGEIDKDMGELLWKSCRQDLSGVMDAVGDHILCVTEDIFHHTNEINIKSCSLVNGDIQKMVNILHPPFKQTLLDCIRKNNIHVHPPVVESKPKSWYIRYLSPFIHSVNAPRRILAGQSIAEPPMFSPAPAPAPASVLERAPAPAPFPVLDPPASPGESFFPPIFKYSPPPTTESFSDSTSNVSRKKDNNNGRSIIIAVVVTALVTFAVAMFLFICCTRVYGKGSLSKRTDERPLLSVSLSDFSIGGSSHAPYAFGNSVKEEKLGQQSFGNNSSIHKKASSWEANFQSETHVMNTSLAVTSSVEAVAGAPKLSPESVDTSRERNAQLPPPPGRMVSGTPGLPPLKPPPGRAVPLPPEPPAPSRTGPPPPPPPVAPSSLRPSSASAGPRPPGPPPPPLPARPCAPPPPPPKGGLAPRPPPPMPFGPKVPRPPGGPKHTVNAASVEGPASGGEADAPKAKLKPFFWDKVAANPDHSMVWNQIKSGSFQFNEEMIETLFGYSNLEKNKNDKKSESSSRDPSPQFVQILDPKKAQNLSILLRALNVTTEEVCDALREGNELPAELLQTLLKMAPTQEEELKLRLFSGELSLLGPAERFLKNMVDIPFVFKRMEALLFMCTLHEEIAFIKESFETLEIACKELRSSRLFLKLLEAVLKTGNRMNDGTFRGGAQAFKLDTLLKLSDVKGVDGKTTLLHFVVQEIIRTEGVRAARAARESKSFSSIKSDDLLEEISHDTEEHYRNLGLQVVSHLSSELENVKKASAVDADNLTGTVAKLGHTLLKTRDFLNSQMKSTEEKGGFHQTLKSFLRDAEPDVMSLLEEEKRIMALVKSTGDYFHGNAGKDEGLRLFAIVRDFLILLDKVCKELRAAPWKPVKSRRKEARQTSSASESRVPTSPDPRLKLFPAIAERRADHSSSSSDDEDL